MNNIDIVLYQAYIIYKITMNNVGVHYNIDNIENPVVSRDYSIN